ncbi:recombinase family protein [Falsiroseomonas sp. E2-1-a20]|uniref:recombinase family protein n=1 Tax=Falsiroseomonas sp. E2-1-a20 TaxID=3239300 RepID=UPI003F360A6F
MAKLPKATRTKALAYLRTSSATNVDGDSAERQRIAIRAYADRAGIEVEAEFYDAAVSGADPVDQRPGFAAMLTRIEGNGVRTILVENASRFARDLAVQLAGHALLQARGIELVPVDAPSYFTDPTPTAVMVRQILGSVAEFDKASTVAKLRGARERASAAAGYRVDGRKATLHGDALAMARRLRRKNPKTGDRRSLRDIAAAMAEAGHVNPHTGKAYSPEAIRLALDNAGAAKA